MKIIKVLAIAAILSLAPSLVMATPVTIEYQLPTENCDNQPIEPVLELEIYVSAGQIPASDAECPAPGSPVDEPPASYSTLISDATNGAAVVDLVGGQTYYARARVRTEHGWSNLSNELSFDVPARPGKAPILIRIGF